VSRLLIISLSRRRRELALLRVSGFVNRQIVTVAWPATVIALIGALVGVPIGIVLGRTIWLTFASRPGVAPDAIVDIPVMTLSDLSFGHCESARRRAGCGRAPNQTGPVVAGIVRGNL
jgi:ABC-type antimicrobial peptide transport system permease subunit